MYKGDNKMFSKIYSKFINFIKNNYKDIIFLVLFACFCMIKTPYLIYEPGGAVDLTDRVQVENSLAKTGKLNMNYVSVGRATIPSLIAAFFINNWDVYRESTITYDEYDYETSFKIDQLDYNNSITSAVLVACSAVESCTFDITSTRSYVIYIDDESETDLKVMDEILTIDGYDYQDLDWLSIYLEQKEFGDRLIIKVNNNGKEYERYAVVKDFEGLKKVGVGILNNYDYTTNPKIHIVTKDYEAGGSGGLMFTLAIINGLSDTDITKGYNVHGTGSIDEYGNVGPIGGVKYKMLGASKNKANIFFVPTENCSEAKQVKKEFKLNMDVVCVNTYLDALNYLNNK